jgi:hypothetical protein
MKNIIKQQEVDKEKGDIISEDLSVKATQQKGKKIIFNESGDDMSKCSCFSHSHRFSHSDDFVTSEAGGEKIGGSEDEDDKKLMRTTMLMAKVKVWVQSEWPGTDIDHWIVQNFHQRHICRRKWELGRLILSPPHILTTNLYPSYHQSKHLQEECKRLLMLVICYFCTMVCLLWCHVIMFQFRMKTCQD